MKQVKHREALGRTRQLRRRQEDLDARYAREEERRALGTERGKYRLTSLWVTLTVISVTGILACAALLLPQIGSEDPAFTFFRKGFITHDRAGEEQLRSDLADMSALSGTAVPDGVTSETPQAAESRLLTAYAGCFGPGVFIDGVDVSMMTPDQARLACWDVPAEGGGDFSITVVIAGLTYTVDSAHVPMTRNLDAVIDEAWARAQQDFNAFPELIDGESGLEYNLRTLRERESRLMAREDEPLVYESRLDYSREALRALTDAIAESVNVEPVDAAVTDFNVQTKTFAVRGEQPGVRLDADTLYRRVADCLDREEIHATVTMEPTAVPPSVTADSLRSRLGRISSYTTKTTSNKNRNTNVRLSAEAINGYRVDPGMIFSFNQATGQRTERKGYKPAVAISGGATRDEIGGGVCQTSSTLFNAVARADLEIVKRTAHAWPSSYVEKGFDATVNWPDIDFRWRNNTDQPVWIVAAYADRQVTVELYGLTLGSDMRIELESKVVKTIPKPEGIQYVQNPELPAGTRKHTVDARKGYEVETWKIWYRDGYELKRELLFPTLYKAYQETWEYN